MTAVIPIIDTSASMTAFDYVAITVVDSQAFIRMSRPGDRIAVVSYDASARVTYPLNGTSMVTVDGLLRVSREAADAIGRLTFLGSATAIGNGVWMARDLIDREARPKGLVLLSDGFNNTGRDPLQSVPTAYPLYTCAMGPQSDQGLLQRMAALSGGGKFYYAPQIFDMMMIFNEIAGRLNPNAGVILNARAILGPSIAAQRFVAPVGPGQEGAQFVVVWDDSTVQYTADAPHDGQIGVRLIQPSGVPWPDPPQVIDPGFVIFNVDAPVAGEWQLSLELPPESALKLDVTVAALEFASIQLQAALDVSADAPGAALQLSSEASVESVDAQAAFVPAVTGAPHAEEHGLKGFLEQLDLTAFAAQEIAVKASGSGGAWSLSLEPPPGGFYTVRTVVHGTRADGSPFQRTVIGSGSTVSQE